MTENEIKFSIIIITLNEENYVGKLLDKLEKQTYKNFEVIVVDGQSEDKTVEIANSFSETLDIKTIIAQKRGPSTQRNRGVLETTNDHIIFFDADILVSANFLEKIKNKLNNKPAVVCLSARHVPSPQNLFHGAMLYLGYIYAKSVSKIKPVALGSFIYVQKNIFNEIGGFDETLTFGEDSDFVRKVTRSGHRFTVLYNPVVEYSMRRVEREGLLKVYRRTLKSVAILRSSDYLSRLKEIEYKFNHYKK